MILNLKFEKLVNFIAKFLLMKNIVYKETDIRNSIVEVKRNLEEINKIKIKTSTKPSEFKLKLAIITAESLNLLQYGILKEKIKANLELKWKHAASVLNRLFLAISIIYFIISFSAIILPVIRP